MTERADEDQSDRSDRTRAARGGIVVAMAIALPPLLLALVGTTHPMVLDATTAHHWWTMHVWLLPVFPLLAVGLVVLLRGEREPLAWAARVAAFLYAVYYTGLDTLSGIAAGIAFDAAGSRDATVERLFAVGNDLGEIGRWTWVAAVVLTLAVLVRRHGPRTLVGGVVTVVGALAFAFDHIYWPWGVAGVALTAVGFAAWELTRR